MKRIIMISLLFTLVLSGCKSNEAPVVSESTDITEVTMNANITESEVIKALNLNMSDDNTATEELKVSITDFNPKYYSEKRMIPQIIEVNVEDEEGLVTSIKTKVQTVESKQQESKRLAAEAKEKEQKELEKFKFDSNVKFNAEEYKAISKSMTWTDVDKLNVIKQCKLNEEVNDQFLADIDAGLDPKQPDNLYTDECGMVATINLTTSSVTKLSADEDVSNLIPTLLSIQAFDKVDAMHVLVYQSNGYKLLEYTFDPDTVSSIRNQDDLINYYAKDYATEYIEN